MFICFAWQRIVAMNAAIFHLIMQLFFFLLLLLLLLFSVTAWLFLCRFFSINHFILNVLTIFVLERELNKNSVDQLKSIGNILQNFVCRLSLPDISKFMNIGVNISVVRCVPIPIESRHIKVSFTQYKSLPKNYDYRVVFGTKYVFLVKTVKTVKITKSFIKGKITYFNFQKKY